MQIENIDIITAAVAKIPLMRQQSQVHYLTGYHKMAFNQLTVKKFKAT